MKERKRGAICILSSVCSIKNPNKLVGLRKHSNSLSLKSEVEILLSYSKNSYPVVWVRLQNKSQNMSNVNPIYSFIQIWEEEDLVSGFFKIS